MNKLGMLGLATALGVGCTDPDKNGKNDTSDIAQCDLAAYVAIDCATDPCPAIAHADPLVDLRTTILAKVFNVGDAVCEPAPLELQLDGLTKELALTPELQPDESMVVFNDQNVFTQADTSLPADEHEITLIVNEGGTVEEGELEDNQFSASFEPRTGVGCIVKGHLLEYVHEDQSKVASACSEEPFDDVKVYNPYCADIQLALEEGVVTGETDTRDVDGDGDTSETVYDTWTCASRAVAATVLFRAYGLEESSDQVCPDVDASAWYAPYMNAVQAATGVLAREDGLCDPEGDLVRPDLEPLLENLDLR